MRIVYVNGEYCQENEAKISVFDRGFLFADAVYEVTTILDGKLVDFDGHIKRLQRSLNELDYDYTVDYDEFLAIHRKLVADNALEEGVVYTQVTRGACDRDFAYDNATLTPSVVLFTQSKKLRASAAAQKGLKVITVKDQRWLRRDIKTTQLLFPSLAKMEAVKQGKDDAWLCHGEQINEGTSNNVFIITHDNKIVTKPCSNRILHGITRAAVLRYASMTNLVVEERDFTIEEAENAQETFITAATLFVTPVIEINNKPVADGLPGAHTKRLREIYIEESLKQAI